MTDSEGGVVDGVAVDDLRAYLEETDVVFAILFGSRARGTERADSDVDVALRFPPESDAEERFRSRNRIDADLQAYAEGFVDVSDLETLPIGVARAALRDGVVVVGDERAVETYRDRVEREYQATAGERERERREFIDRLASGDV